MGSAAIPGWRSPVLFLFVQRGVAAGALDQIIVRTKPGAMVGMY
jgi:hypothetical protein